VVAVAAGAVWLLLLLEQSLADATRESMSEYICSHWEAIMTGERARLLWFNWASLEVHTRRANFLANHKQAQKKLCKQCS